MTSMVPRNIYIWGTLKQVPLPEGGLVPKSMYMTSVDHLEKERNLESPPLCEDIYHCITLQKVEFYFVEKSRSLINNQADFI